MDIPKARVTETSDGEISCSVEETNRIRALLGLKPLNVGPAKKETVVDVRVDRDREKQQSEVQQRIERSRREREAAGASSSSTAGPSTGFGEHLPEKAMSAAQWVALSRAAPQPSAAAAPGRKKATAPAGAVGSEIAGARIAHSADEFEPGQEAGVVLTLRDKGVLDGEGGGDGDDDDAEELVNVDLAAAADAKARAERKAKSSQPIYSARDDAEFRSGAGAGGAGKAGSSAAGPQRQVHSVSVRRGG